MGRKATGLSLGGLDMVAGLPGNIGYCHSKNCLNLRALQNPPSSFLRFILSPINQPKSFFIFLMNRRLWLVFVLMFVMGLYACGGGGGSSSSSSSSLLKETALWTWVSGSNTVNQVGTYGTKGVADSANIPGAREGAVSWTDAKGNLWLFGGCIVDLAGNQDDLNDLWKFDGTNWIWVSGSNTVEQAGTYGTKGVAASANIPGAREEAVSWTDAKGNFWLFGGYGVDSAGNQGDLNDLWKFDGTNWTWVSGSNTGAQIGAYGTQGIGNQANIPGARERAVSWTDAKGNLWLFGGYGYDSVGHQGDSSDLWKYDGTNWTWVSGSNTIEQAGTYGTKGVAASANIPGAREGAVSWTDAKGNLWLFGGYGLDSSGNQGDLNDLWKYDGTNWTWVSGGNTIDQAGTYGSKGEPDPANIPGARNIAVSWTDTHGNLWLFGGYGYDSAGNQDDLNDLWKYDGTNWTWVSGSNTIDQAGTYGSKGEPDSTNVPGAREGAVSWTDAKGNLWLFGGYNLNDLWQYTL